MIRFVRGNLFDSHAEALVNTVNCVGIMGKGIAYQFKRAYPEMFADYKARCQRGEVRLGEVSLFRERGRVIVNFPTKQHWRSRSRIEDIVAGLSSLCEAVRREEIRSLAVPPLGCGNGGLPWPEVRKTVQGGLAELDEIEIEVYEPVGRFTAEVAREPKLSLAHYVLVALRSKLRHPNRLTLQKAAYFFNVFTGEEYFRFTEHKFGPYCIALEPMFKAIRDYLDFRNVSPAEMVEDGLRQRLPGKDADRLQEWMEVLDQVASFCNSEHSRLEALATAHAVIHRCGPIAMNEAVGEFLSWSPEKSTRFNAEDARSAIDGLVAQGLLERGLVGLVTREPVLS
jgi:O-acetyl-ADP-ribose deacetylase (regulator of RNase III)